LKVYNRVLSRYVCSLTENHAEHCPWKKFYCSEKLLLPFLFSPKNALTYFIDCVTENYNKIKLFNISLETFLVALSLPEAFIDTVHTWYERNNLDWNFFLQNLPDDPQLKNSKFIKHCVFFSLYGWKFKFNSLMSTWMLFCQFCNRSLGNFSFDSNKVWTLTESSDMWKNKAKVNISQEASEQIFESSYFVFQNAHYCTCPWTYIEGQKAVNEPLTGLQLFHNLLTQSAEQNYTDLTEVDKKQKSVINVLNRIRIKKSFNF
jgi:hypothetical protein